jgi:GntR family transcriptional regulator/MocR family aminotransferase
VSGAQLLLESVAPGQVRRAALEQALREAVRAGRLGPGARLPSSRTLAAELRCSRRLVAEAYGQLVAEGFLVARHGSGTRVAPGATAAAQRAAAPAPARPAARIDLFPGSPDLSLFPRRAWARALRTALAELPDAELGYGPREGHPRLRAALAEHLGRVRGALAAPATTLVTSGYAGGLRLVLDVLAGRGARRVGLEDPGYQFNPAAVRRAGLEVVAVPTGADGIDTAALRRLDPDVVVVTPSHTHPLGGVLAPEGRAELLAWARERDRLIVEDDYDAEFRYDRDPVGALQGLAPDREILAGTASKLLAPALRLGWLVAPPDLVAPLREAALVQEHGGPALDQVALAVLFESGAIERHVRAGRARYRARRTALLEALAERLPECPVGGIEAGLTVWIGLPAGVDEAAFVAETERRGVRTYPLATSRIECDEPRGLVLGYANASERELREAVEVLRAALQVQRRDSCSGGSGPPMST